MPDTPEAPEDTSIDAWLGNPSSGPGLRAVDPAVKKRRHKLLVYAFRISKNVAEAEDLVQEAVARVKAGTRQWDGTKSEEEKITAMSSIIQSLLSHRREAPASRYERIYAEPHSKRVADQAPLAVDLLVTIEDEAAEEAWLQDVRAQAALKKEGPFLTQLIDLSQKGISDIDELATHTGRERDDVKAARKTLRRLVEANIPKHHAESLDRWRGRGPEGAPAVDASLAVDGDSEEQL